VTGTLRSVDPATGAEVARYPAFTAAEVDAALAAAHEAQRVWRGVSLDERARLLTGAAGRLRERRERYATLITREMGKPIVEARAELDKCAWTCGFYAEQAAAFLAPEPVETAADDSFVTYEPLGVVLAIRPWNFPFWQVTRFAAPALMAGDGGLLKHAPNVSGCALAFERVLADAGFPDGLFRTLLVDEGSVAETTARLLGDPRIAAVTITGSDRAGAHVAAAAGRALKKSVLELGGSDPFLVLADADLPAAAEQAARSRFLNGGQSCLAAKRFVVEEPVADEFEGRLVDAVEALAVGDPMDPATRVGPMARADLVDGIDRQVRESVARGARVLTGGRRIGDRGCFYAPTVLTGVRAGMPAYEEETFGPVAAVIRVADEAQAIAVANDTAYGLGASVWTRDVDRGLGVAGQLESGAVFVNAVVASDPRLPFGGTKRSGYGRELSAAGIREFTNLRTWWVSGAAAPDPGAALTE
jgi:succinate-semialdehyde dehydrogenase / glutarate-semialdehyde dehydrogenase